MHEKKTFNYLSAKGLQDGCDIYQQLQHCDSVLHESLNCNDRIQD